MQRTAILMVCLTMVTTMTGAASTRPPTKLPQKKQKGSEQPNIVFVLADDLGMADVGYNGDLTLAGALKTPVLDALAAESTKLTRFYANALCTPSRASLLTGRFASRTNMKSPDGYALARSLHEDEQLLPELLKNMGYQTHMVGKWHLGQHERKYTPVGRGFDSFCGNLGGALDYFHHNHAPPTPVVPGMYRPHDLHCAYNVESDADDDYSYDDDGEDGDSTGPATCGLLTGVDYHANETTSTQRIKIDFAQAPIESFFPDEATYGDYYITNMYGRKNVGIIEAHDADKGPLFLYAAFTAGHVPLQALAEDFAECDPGIIPDEERRVLCAMTYSLDRNTGYIIDALKQKGMWENTLFIFASDNGGWVNDGGDNGPFRGQKGQHYEGGVRAPAFMHFGENTTKHVARTQGIEMDQSIHLVDLFSTIVSVASDGEGDQFANEVDGRDLWKYLSRGRSIPRQKAKVNFNLAAGVGFLSAFTRSLFNEDGSYVEAVIATYGDVDYKLCRNCAGFEGDEIYDLFADPSESTNLVGLDEHAGVEAFLNGVLADWAAASFPQLKYPTLVERAAELLEEAGLDPALADRLVNTQRCYIPLDSPEFICSDCSELAFDFPTTTSPPVILNGMVNQHVA